MKPSIQKKLQSLSERHEEVGALLADAGIISQQSRFRALSKEYAELEPVVAVYKSYMACLEMIDDATHLLKEPDAEMQELAKEELKKGEATLIQLENTLQLLLLPRDPHDNSNIFLEIRAGAGGNEASIFAGDLFRMYSRYAESNGWQVELISRSVGEQGGFKEIIARILVQGASSPFKLESGVHRVQRIPATQAQGRVHTSP